MNIGILTDSLIANLPLMKIARYHKNDNVKWYIPLDKNIDILYISKIFNYTRLEYLIDNYKIGGTGHDVKSSLPAEIDKCQPDYSIYPECDYSLQFLSRGCIRKCKFCVVPEKEGSIYSVKPMSLNPKGKYIRVLDNNFFANPLWRDAIEYLKTINQPVYFDGIDIRIFNDEQGGALRKIKIHKMLHIAWDNAKQDLTDKIKLMIKFIKAYRIMVYVLIGFDSTPEQDYFRVMKIKETGCNPFVMPYNKKDKYQKQFARWVNHKAIFKSVKWEDYNKFIDNRNIRANWREGG